MKLWPVRHPLVLLKPPLARPPPCRCCGVWLSTAQVCRLSVAALGLLQHSQHVLSDEALYAEEKVVVILPNHLSVLHRVACEQPGMIPQVRVQSVQWLAGWRPEGAAQASTCVVDGDSSARICHGRAAANSFLWRKAAATVQRRNPSHVAYAAAWRGVQVLSVLRTVVAALGASHMELSRSVNTLLVSLIVSGASGSTLELVQDWSKTADPSLLRHFIGLGGALAGWWCSSRQWHQRECTAWGVHLPACVQGCA